MSKNIRPYCESGLLNKEFGYTANTVKISNLISENKDRVQTGDLNSKGAKRIVDLQEVGTKLRKSFGEDYLVRKAIELIALERVDKGGYKELKNGGSESTVLLPLPMRKVTFIDSLKHPKESKLLKSVYGGLYWQFTVFAPEDVRAKRLHELGVDKGKLPGIFTRDENDKSDHGQKVSDTAILSDFFIRNDADNDDRLVATINRFLEIMFNVSVQTPTPDEAGMYTAVAAANKSACLSRQVGAAIYSEVNELVSIGWNDVPKVLGGLYNVSDDKNDHRCFKWKGKICHNDNRKEKLYEAIFEQFKHIIKDEVKFDEVRNALRMTPVKNLIEYSRSIHAEMEAIVSAARTGKAGLVRSNLYTTTFPCHNCARHIVAAGIKNVYYIEPYSKSLALNLHMDAISTDEKDTKKVRFLQYEGVGPLSMLKLFQHGTERKNNGKVHKISKKDAIPILPPPIDGFTTHENRVIQDLEVIQNEA